ncbi:FecCD family ABC transporter permease [Pelagibacterium xiamenense]|uniref:FecCD family ABC transporter permease n=1 Tax=Pelagibacterium xiamenense TaxID=2901140 RepID=UPI001E3D5542|nr:iron ABC transporter permease [Pelagibacterium xiamenense]MCD7058672.1 iron ABC transporter permease [Pelagibacterium xiamenense]
MSTSAGTASDHVVIRSRGERVALRLPVRALVAVGVLAVLLLAVIGVSLTVGSYGIELETVITTLTGTTVSDAIDNVVWQFRFPRTLAAALVGAMMALSGGALQNVTRNGLADPSLVGISQGAALAVVFAIVAAPGLDYSWRPIIAFSGALAVATLVQALSYQRRRGNNAIRFILLGIGVSAFISSITSALLTYGDIDRAISALSWLAGSINAASWTDVQILFVWCVVLSPLVLGLTRIMSVLRMGEDTAVGLGAPVKWVRYALICVGVGFAAAATAIVGPLGFVGLLAPHAARRIARSGVGLHTVLTALCGALLVALADLVGRAAFAPIQIPAGLITAIIGVPVFVYLLQRAAAKSHL